MTPLIDCDVLRYEIGACGEYYEEKEDGERELIIRDFEFVRELFDAKIQEIVDLTWSTEAPLLFLTVDARTKAIMNRPLSKRLKEEPDLAALMEFKPNFRESVAVSKPYKGTRKQEKPFHYDNLTAYILSNFDCITAEGLEADDLLAIYQTRMNKEGIPTIICTRDKDLRMVPGMHFGWACGLQGAFGPELVSDIGRLIPIYKNEKLKDLKGTGMAFFCKQLITGDTVDNIPGLPRKGPVVALELLGECKTIDEMLIAVRDAYKGVYGESWEEHLLEQGRLLWMVRELDNGLPVMWEIPEVMYELVEQ